MGTRSCNSYSTFTRTPPPKCGELDLWLESDLFSVYFITLKSITSFKIVSNDFLFIAAAFWLRGGRETENKKSGTQYKLNSGLSHPADKLH